MISINWLIFLIIIFSLNPILAKLIFISSLLQADNSGLLTRPLDVLRDLCGYSLIFILWRVVIFNNSSAYFFFVTSITVAGCFYRFRCHICFEISLYWEDFVIGFSSVDTRTMKLGKEVVISSMSLFAYACVWIGSLG